MTIEAAEVVAKKSQQDMAHLDGDLIEYITVFVGEQLFGIPVTVVQDDMISFLGLHEGSLALIDDAIAAGRTNISNAPAGIRADTISIGGAFLRYINCPQRPFIDGDEADVCDGI